MYGFRWKSYSAKRSTMNFKKTRGLTDRSVEPRFLVIGKIIKPHGVHGEMRLEVHTDLPERFTWLKEVYVGETPLKSFAVESVRFHKTWVLIKLLGVESRDEVESLRGQWVQVPKHESISLEEGEYFLYQIIGASVYGDDGDFIGEITDVIETKANNVFVVQGPYGEVLLPDIDEVIKQVNLDSGLVIVHLIPGLIP